MPDKEIHDAQSLASEHWQRLAEELRSASPDFTSAAEKMTAALAARPEGRSWDALSAYAEQLRQAGAAFEGCKQEAQKTRGASDAFARAEFDAYAKAAADAYRLDDATDPAARCERVRLGCLAQGLASESYGSQGTVASVVDKDQKGIGDPTPRDRMCQLFDNLPYWHRDRSAKYGGRLEGAEKSIDGFYEERASRHRSMTPRGRWRAPEQADPLARSLVSMWAAYQRHLRTEA